MVINFIIIVVFLMLVFMLNAWFKHKRGCIEISAKNRIEFFKHAKEMLAVGGLSEGQKEKIFKWADTIESKKHAYSMVRAITELHREIKQGIYPKADQEQRAEFTDELAKLFTHWMIAQIYSVPILSPFVWQSLMYIISAKQSDSSVDIEVNRDVFKQDMYCAAAA